MYLSKPLSLSPVPGRPQTAYYPTTERQKASWKEYVEGGKRRIQNTNTIFNVNDLDVPSVEKTLKSLLDRHDSLRTTFRLIKGCLEQVVHQADKFSVAVEQRTCSGLFASNNIRRTIAQTTKAHFDLETGPLFGITLIHSATNQTKVVIVAHHIISDAVSIQILKDEFLYFYGCFQNNRASDRPPLSYQLKDFAQWEQRYLQGPQGRRNQLYWLEQLNNGLSQFNVLQKWQPPKKYFSLKKNLNGGEYVTFVSQPLLENIKSYVRDIKSSKLCFFYVTLFCLLHRISQQNELVIIVPISLRDRRELQQVIGYLTTDIYLRMRMDETLSLQEMMAMASQKYFSALDHRHHQIDKVQTCGRRYCAAVLNELPPQNEIIKNTRPRFVTKNSGFKMPFPLFLMLTEYNNGLQINCAYNNEILNGGSIPTIINSYLNLLTIAVNNPTYSISRLLRSLSDHSTN